MTVLSETTLAGEVRAVVSLARDNGETVDRDVSFCLAVADLLEVPDDMPLLPAVLAAMETPTQLDDAESVAFTRKIAHAAGRGTLASTTGTA